MRLFKYLGKHKGAVALVFVLLMCQAFCDLMLPNFTAQIVDVGIQQSGIDHVSPDHLSVQTYVAIDGQLSGDDQALFESSYAADEAGETYALVNQETESRARLDEAMAVPLAEVHGLAQPDMDEALVAQVGIVAARAEYELLGRDVFAMQMSYLLFTALKMMGFVVLSVIIASLVGLVAARTGAKIGRSLRTQLFTKVMSFSDAEVQKFSAASLITRGTNDIQQIQMMSIMMLRMVLYSPILAIGGIIMVARLNVSMGWIIGAAIGVIVVVVFILMAIAIPKFRLMQKLVDRVNLVSREMLTGVPVVRAFGQQAHEQQRFDVASTDLMRTQLFTNRVMTFLMPTMMMVMNLASVAIVWFGAQTVDAGTLQTGDLIAFITYSMIIILGFFMLSMLAIIAPRADVSAQRIDEVLDAEVSIVDPDNATCPPEGRATLSRSDSPRFVGSATGASESLRNSLGEGSPAPRAADDGTRLVSTAESIGRNSLDEGSAVPRAGATAGASIDFDHVSFRYEDDAEYVLSDVSFTVEPGSTCAIIGSTGSGKSTILKLVERFYDVTEGAVRVDGVDVRDMPLHDLRAQFGYVPQRAFLFTGTIASNVGFAVDGVDETRLREAIDIAQASDFVDAKDDGLEAEITQGGTNVSGGQRQRLAIARALATDARAFLFDDSFSALDYKTDAALRRALAERLPGKTQVIVAQRIATVLHADKIIVLDEGQVVGQGTHAELIATCPQYREIAYSQLSPDELDRPSAQSADAEGGERR